MHGARAVVECRDKQSPGLSAWLNQLAARAHSNVVTIALANKTARVIWAVLSKEQAYRPPLLACQADAVAC